MLGYQMSWRSRLWTASDIDQRGGIIADFTLKGGPAEDSLDIVQLCSNAANCLLESGPLVNKDQYEQSHS